MDGQLKQACERAAELCKADLLTGVVGEFPELQGIMGGEYAKHDGESEAVSQAIREQYLPRSIEGELPQDHRWSSAVVGRPAGYVGGFFPRGSRTDRIGRPLRVAQECHGHRPDYS